jgi:hypothetical protein
MKASCLEAMTRRGDAMQAKCCEVISRAVKLGM